MRLDDIAEGRSPSEDRTPKTALHEYTARDTRRVQRWRDQFPTDQISRP
jgi:predicted transcriptional regulator